MITGLSLTLALAAALRAALYGIRIGVLYAKYGQPTDKTRHLYAGQGFGLLISTAVTIGAAFTAGYWL